MLLDGDVALPRTKAVYSAWLLSRSTLWIVGMMMAVIMPALVLGMAVGAAMGAAFVLSILAASVLSMAGLLLEAYSRVRVGQDGIVVRRRLTTHYFPFADLADAFEVDGVVLRLVLRSGQYVDLFTGKEEHAGKPEYQKHCDEVLARVRAGIGRHRQAADEPGADAEALHCRAYSVLRESVPPQKTPYREAPAPETAQLLDVAERSTEAPATRAAAAVLLSEDGDARVRQRLRIAADETVHPKLQRLLRIASDDGPPSELSDAFEELQAAAEAEAAVTANRGAR